MEHHQEVRPPSGLFFEQYESTPVLHFGSTLSSLATQESLDKVTIMTCIFSLFHIEANRALMEWEGAWVVAW